MDVGWAMKSIKIPEKVARNALSFFKRFDNSADAEIEPHEAVALIGQFQYALKERRTAWVLKKPARERRKAKQVTKRETWAQIRDAVLDRAGGQCEGGVAGQVHKGMLSVDHMFGGSGRRQALQSKFTCWALCARCHWLKTENKPDAPFWLWAFVNHCAVQASPFGDMAEDEPSGYSHAASIAKARLEALQTQSQLAHPRSEK